MVTYKCTCRFNILLIIDNKVQEIRPGQLLELDKSTTHKFLQLVEVEKPKKKYKKKNDLIKANMDCITESYSLASAWAEKQDDLQLVEV